jgi:hypothetical protein
VTRAQASDGEEEEAERSRWLALEKQKSRPLQLCCGLKVKHLFPLAGPGEQACDGVASGWEPRKRRKPSDFRRKPQAATRFFSFGDSCRFAPEVPIQSRHSPICCACIGLLYFHLVYGRGKIFVVFFVFHSFR